MRGTSLEAKVREELMRVHGYYRSLLERGVELEDARYVLPLSTATSFFSASSLESLLYAVLKVRSMAESAAEEIGAEPFHLASSRDPLTGQVTVRAEGIDASGKRVLLVDDIVSTGGTMVGAVKELLGSGAREVVVSCVHGLFVGDAAERLVKAGASAIVSTDTVPTDHSKVSVIGEVARAIRERMEWG